MSFPARKFTFPCLWLLATLLRFGWTQDVRDNSRSEGVHISTGRLLFPITAKAQTSITTAASNRFRRAPAGADASFCLTPPEPANGQYNLDFCDAAANCTASRGTAVKPGSRLVYRCNAGYRARGNTDVYCSVRGEWSAIPECLEVKCDSLASASTMATCTRFAKWVSCDFPVPPETRAEVTCRHGYKKDTNFITSRRRVINCNIKGQWEPQPIRCIPVCGRTITHQQPLVYGGSPAKIGDFPWHVSLFVEERSPTESKKVFICGGTILKTNLVLTAAHCVYDERTRTTQDPGRLFVITGNIFRDYDFPLHNPAIVRKASVKNVYTNCNYYGIIGNYISDIALLELQQAFEFSSILLPACVDDSGNTDQFLEPGVFGKVAGFGRTEAGTTSGILQTLSLPYISYSQCKASDDATLNEAFISSDKFCAGYNNGSAVCEGDSGGGLVFKKGDLWYVMGIVSVGLGVDLNNGEKTCDKFSYSLYTKVSAYMTWIQDVMFHVERNRLYPPCISNSQSTTESIIVPINDYVEDAPTPCLSPPQPVNGEWRLDSAHCESFTDCSIPEGTTLRRGMTLYYTCAPGFILDGPDIATCGDDGKWWLLPICINASCSLSDGSSGVCTFLKHCPSESQAMTAGMSPDTECKSSGFRSIVCCPLPPAIVPKNLNTDGRGGIAKQKCLEYSQHSSPSRCPSADKELPNRSSLGLFRAEEMEYPHLAAIGFPLSYDADSVSWDCGGTLISEIFVLTSAACIDTRPLGNATLVRVGKVDGSLYEERRIAERIIHPEYKPPSKYHDIGLIRLDSSISFDDWIRPACLHTASSIGTRVALTSKWGYTDSAGDGGSTHLFRVNVPIVDQPICKARWASGMGAAGAKQITESAESEASVPETQLAKEVVGDLLICAGATGHMVCQGDPGSPLVIHRVGEGKELCMYNVIGVMSLTKPCESRIPALYTRVYNYVPWIETMVWGQ